MLCCVIKYILYSTDGRWCIEITRAHPLVHRHLGTEVQCLLLPTQGFEAQRLHIAAQATNLTTQ